MRLSYVRLPLLAATAWLGIGFSVWAMDIRYGETVFVTPTSTTYSLTPSYLVSRSYVTPTAYVVPSYDSTARVVPTVFSTSYVAEPLSLLPTTYVATTYRRGLFGRRWLVERPVLASYATTYIPSAYISRYATTYLPSAYVLPTYYATSYRSRIYTPTVYEYPAVWETGAVISRPSDCDEIAWAPTLSSPSSVSDGPPAPAAVHARSNRGQTRPSLRTWMPFRRRRLPRAPPARMPRAGQRIVRPSHPAQQSTRSPPVISLSLPVPVPPEGARDDSAAARSPVDTPPSTTPATPTAPGTDEKIPPLLPAPGQDNSQTTIRREAGRPVYRSLPLRPERRNVLIGKVENSTGDPQEEVPVSVTSRSNRSIHHDGLTNAFGGFAIRLPDGTWTVNVTMPSGRIYPVRSITVSNGRVLDDQEGREVPNLIISY